LLLGDWLQLWLHSLSSKGYTAFLFLLLSRFEFEIQDLIVIMQKTSSNAKFWSTQRILFPVNFFFQIKNIKLSSRHKSLVDQVDYNELKEMNTPSSSSWKKKEEEERNETQNSSLMINHWRRVWSWHLNFWNGGGIWKINHVIREDKKQFSIVIIF